MDNSVLNHRPRDVAKLRLTDIKIDCVMRPPSTGDEAVLEVDEVFFKTEAAYNHWKRRRII